jgi:hypothetical protein
MRLVGLRAGRLLLEISQEKCRVVGRKSRTRQRDAKFWFLVWEKEEITLRQLRHSQDVAFQTLVWLTSRAGSYLTDGGVCGCATPHTHTPGHLNRGIDLEEVWY